MDAKEIYKWVHKNKPHSICVEAAHIYMDEKPNKSHRISAQIGADIANQLKKDGHIVIKQLFIDDYNPDVKNFILDVGSYLELIGSCGFSPDILTLESSLEMPANNLLAKIITQNNLVRHEQKVYLEKKKACLVNNNRPTCNLLDAALYIAKLSMFEMAITVLPKSLKGQQKKVRKILKILGYSNIPIFNIYH